MLGVFCFLCFFFDSIPWLLLCEYVLKLKNVSEFIHPTELMSDCYSSSLLQNKKKKLQCTKNKIKNKLQCTEKKTKKEEEEDEWFEPKKETIRCKNEKLP